MTPVSREAIYVDLLATARRRFGDDRATVLIPELEALATHLALVAEASVPDDVEPDFLAPSE